MVVQPRERIFRPAANCDSFFAGVISTILIRTTWRTLRQVRNLRDRSRGQRMERELAEMKQKAATLQTKPIPTADPIDPARQPRPPDGMRKAHCDATR